MMRIVMLGVATAACAVAVASVVIGQDRQTTATPIVSVDRQTAEFLSKARTAMGLTADLARTLSIEATRWRSAPPPTAQIGTPATVLVFPDRCMIHDGLTHIVAGDAFWQVPVPAKGTPPRARYNISRRCAVDALAFTLQGFTAFPFTATHVGPWNEHGLSGEAVEFRAPDAYRVVMVFDGVTHQRLGLVEYGEAGGVPTPRISRFHEMTGATRGLQWPRVLLDTIGTTTLELRISKVEVNADVEATVFHRPSP